MYHVLAHVVGHIVLHWVYTSLIQPCVEAERARQAEKRREKTRRKRINQQHRKRRRGKLFRRRTAVQETELEEVELCSNQELKDLSEGEPLTPLSDYDIGLLRPAAKRTFY